MKIKNQISQQDRFIIVDQYNHINEIVNTGFTHRNIKIHGTEVGLWIIKKVKNNEENF